MVMVKLDISVSRGICVFIVLNQSFVSTNVGQVGFHLLKMVIQ